MMIEKELKMKKVLAGLIVAGALVAPTAEAHGHGGFGPWLPFGAGVVLGTVITNRPAYVYQQVPPPQVIYQQPQTVYVYPTQAPTMPSAQFGQVCELKSEMINGQVVTGNFCYTR